MFKYTQDITIFLCLPYLFPLSSLSSLLSHTPSDQQLSGQMSTVCRKGVGMGDEHTASSVFEGIEVAERRQR